MLYFNKNKKIFAGLFLTFFAFALFFSFLNTTFAQDPGPTPGPLGTSVITPTATDSGGTNATNSNTNPGVVNVLSDEEAEEQKQKETYTPLAGLPGIEAGVPYDTTGKCPLGKYLSILFNLFLGIAAVLAMIMIFVGGLEYMGSELISSKESGMSKVKNAIAGLLLALASYLILNEINPKLLNICLGDIPNKNITIGPEAGDGTVDTNCKEGGATYSTNTPMSPALAPAIEKLKDGWEISKINVYSDGTVQIDLKKGSEFDNSTYIGMSPGLNGFAPLGTAVSQDKKTPLGNFSITDVQYTPGKAQCSGTGSNMGAAFWNLGVGNRGIGIHGNENGTLGRTNGCVRLTNADILALQPYIKTGIPVIIQ